MGGEERKFNSYANFRDHVLPRIAKLGFNFVQLMAVPEHAYYGSYGYHICNLFAPSSRCGTPDDFKSLVDRAHALGLRVILDLCISHSSKNAVDGIADMDGSGRMYFYAGDRGYQSLWDARIFDYGKTEVQRYLLSNIRYWLEEFQVDGFRMDAVTSMIYTHHGIHHEFTGSLTDYFNPNLELDALALLMAAIRVGKSALPDSIFIAEEVSGFPQLAIAQEYCGIGFDYNLSMYCPDFCAQLTREFNYNGRIISVDKVPGAFLNRKQGENYIGYTESHDQSINGSQSLLSQLVSPEQAMEALRHPISRRNRDCINVWKALVTLTFLMGGEGLMVFMGNEFGHPDWIEAPNSMNGGSFEKARRRWSLLTLATHAFAELQEFTHSVLQLKSTYHQFDDELTDDQKKSEILSYTEPLLIKRGRYMIRAGFNTHDIGHSFGKAIFATSKPGEETSTKGWVIVEEIA
jgi:1,4-alpha-glucan branching enzyme